LCLFLVVSRWLEIPSGLVIRCPTKQPTTSWHLSTCFSFGCLDKLTFNVLRIPRRKCLLSCSSPVENVTWGRAVWRRDYVLRSACGESDKPKEDLQEELQYDLIMNLRAGLSFFIFAMRVWILCGVSAACCFTWLAYFFLSSKGMDPTPVLPIFLALLLFFCRCIFFSKEADSARMHGRTTAREAAPGPGFVFCVRRLSLPPNCSAQSCPCVLV